MRQRKTLWEDTGGDAVVEATILFPIIIMIFAGLVLLSMYLPTRANLQRATQYAATALATQHSDTWLVHDAESLTYDWKTSRNELGTVYGALLGSLTGKSLDDAGSVEEIVTKMDGRGLLEPPGELTVGYEVVNYVIYKEIVVTATRTIPMPVDLSFVKFPKEIPITVTSTAVVQNGDEFVRNMDIAADFMEYLSDKYNLDEVFGRVGELLGKFNELLGI